MQVALLICALTAMDGTPTELLSQPSAGASLMSGDVDAFVVSPAETGRVAALARGRAFERRGAGNWVEIGAWAVAGWKPLAPPVRDRLPTGEVLKQAGQLPNGLHLGLVAAGIVESNDRFLHATGPTGLPLVSAALGAPMPGAADRLLVTGQPAGLFVCEEGQCTRALDGAFTAVAWFADDTRLACERNGDVWRYADGLWTRTLQAGAAITTLTGVPDGGPRHVATADGRAWRSEDHGLTWVEAALPGGRLGSGGQLAIVTGDGALDIKRVDGTTDRYLQPGTVPEGAPVRWASPNVVLVGLADGAIAVERQSMRTRRLLYPAGQEHPFLGGVVVGETLLIYGAHGGQLLRFETAGEAPLTWERFIEDALSGGGFILALVALLGALGIWINWRSNRVKGTGGSR